MNKKEGAIFSKEQILNYRNRRKLSDTVLFNKKYKRFEINSPWNYTRGSTSIRRTPFCLIPFTDTPKRIMEDGWSASIPTIKRTDIFVSLQLFPEKIGMMRLKKFLSLTIL
jgi:hypothetical protein